MDVISSFDKLKKFEYEDAGTAFNRYSSIRCEIIPGDTTLTINSETGGNFLTGFNIQLTGFPEVRDDGRLINCDVYDFAGRLLARNIRMAFIKNTEPELAVKQLKAGDRLMVLGSPRVNLTEIESRVKKSDTDKNILRENLPYEMIVLALLDD